MFMPGVNFISGTNCEMNDEIGGVLHEDVYLCFADHAP